ncbi:MAG: S-methyl-5-thioribose-1-phosphate isomerase [Deferribacterales bacterium]|nr:S-methyl-5-thioribose-1-phosphate isomerase [Deferribacterales bacterium]
MENFSLPRAVDFKDDRLFILDQTKLPLKTEIIELKTIEEVWKAINILMVRGAPAIGIAAAYGLLVGLKPFKEHQPAEFKAKVLDLCQYLNSARPTAVNLSYSLARMSRAAVSSPDLNSCEIYLRLTDEAHTIYKEEIDSCRKIGQAGAELIKNGFGVLTHCNAGALAVSEWGTALAPIYEAMRTGKKFKVYADETRPLLQGSRLTAWELQVSGADVTLICDNMAAYAMSKGLINLVITGCDRVAANGDAANKIGTLGVAILAKHYGIPFYIACPCSTFDSDTEEGHNIVIEERPSYEVTSFGGVRTAPDGVKVLNPSFDVTPSELISGFITDKGIIKPPFKENLKILKADN